jgi:hypothetical protein
LTTWFQKTKPSSIIPPTISAPLKIQATTAASSARDTVEHKGPSQPPTPPFLIDFQALVASLPTTVPYGTHDDRLAAFSGDPERLVDGRSNEELWEDVVNPLLDRTLSGIQEDKEGELIRRGTMGLDGFCAFVGFWIGKGLDPVLFIPRVERITYIINKCVYFE